MSRDRFITTVGAVVFVSAIVAAYWLLRLSLAHFGGGGN